MYPHQMCTAESAPDNVREEASLGGMVWVDSTQRFTDSFVETDLDER